MLKNQINSIHQHGSKSVCFAVLQNKFIVFRLLLRKRILILNPSPGFMVNVRHIFPPVKIMNFNYFLRLRESTDGNRTLCAVILHDLPPCMQCIYDSGDLIAPLIEHIVIKCRSFIKADTFQLSTLLPIPLPGIHHMIRSGAVKQFLCFSLELQQRLRNILCFHLSFANKTVCVPLLKSNFHYAALLSATRQMLVGIIILTPSSSISISWLPAFVQVASGPMLSIFTFQPSLIIDHSSFIQLSAHGVSPSLLQLYLHNFHDILSGFSLRPPSCIRCSRTPSHIPNSS
nr:MAG TPA: hypothetical protein [Caudoviricetes sp.]